MQTVTLCYTMHKNVNKQRITGKQLHCCVNETSFYWIPLGFLQSSVFPLQALSLKDEVETKVLFFLSWQNF